MKKKISLLVNNLSKLNEVYLFGLLGIFVLIPLLLLSFFDHPSSDDFGYSYETLKFGFYKIQIDRYYDWSGRYFSNAILSVDPLVYNNFTFYKVIPVILFILFIYSLYYFLQNLFIGLNKKYILSLVGFLFFLYYTQMLDVCEGFFWLPGSITYQLANILFIFLISFILKYYRTSKIIHIVISSILLFAIIGSNEIITLILAFIFFIVLVFQYYYKRKIDRVLLFLFVLTIGFTLFSVLAPGNSVRETYIDVKHQFFYSVIKTIFYSIYYTIKWISLPLLCSLLLVENYNELLAKIKLGNVYIHPIFSFLIMFLVVCSGVFPGFWSLNNQPPNRALNTVYFFFLFAFIYFLMTLFVYLKEVRNHSFIIPSYIKMIIGFCIIITTITNSNVLGSYSDLLTGRAYKFDKEMKDRYNLINNSKSKDCVVPALRNIPCTIFGVQDMEITTDKNNWKNDAMRKYYNKRSLIIDSTSISLE